MTSAGAVTVTSGIQTVGMPGCPGGSLADLGGVAGPVSAGEAVRGDRDVGVNAQGAGEDRGGDFGGELEQCGAAGLVGLDPEVGEPLGQSCGADRSSGLAPGEQPGRWCPGSD